MKTPHFKNDFHQGDFK